MFKTKTAFLSLLLSFSLFLFAINSIYGGAFAFINPFFYVYYGVASILLFSIMGPASAIPIALSFSVAVGIIAGYYGTGINSGYLGYHVLGRFFISVAIVQFLVFIAIPYFFSYLISKGYGFTKSICYPVIAVFVIFFSIAALHIFAGKINIISSINYFSGIMTKKLADTYNRMGMKYLATLKMQKLIFKMLKFVFLLLPSVLIIFSWLSIWISFIFLKKISKKTNRFFYGLKENLLLWRASDYFLIFLIAGIAVSVFSFGLYKFIGYNIILLSSSVYLVQGLTVVAFVFNKFNANIFLRILGYGIIFIFGNPLLIFIIMTGIFDMWFNFRKIEIKKGG